MSVRPFLASSIKCLDDIRGIFRLIDEKSDGIYMVIVSRTVGLRNLEDEIANNGSAHPVEQGYRRSLPARQGCFTAVRPEEADSLSYGLQLNSVGQDGPLSRRIAEVWLENMATVHLFFLIRSSKLRPIIDGNSFPRCIIKSGVYSLPQGHSAH